MWITVTVLGVTFMICSVIVFTVIMEHKRPKTVYPNICKCCKRTMNQGIEGHWDCGKKRSGPQTEPRDWPF